MELRRFLFVLLLIPLYFLPGCAALPVVVPILTYVASINNLGAETLKFVDDKPTSCPITPSPLIDPTTIITANPLITSTNSSK